MAQNVSSVSKTSLLQNCELDQVYIQLHCPYQNLVFVPNSSPYFLAEFKLTMMLLLKALLNIGHHWRNEKLFEAPRGDITGPSGQITGCVWVDFPCLTESICHRQPPLLTTLSVSVIFT